MEMLTRCESLEDLVKEAVEDYGAIHDEDNGEFVPTVLVCWFPDGHSRMIDLKGDNAQQFLNGVMEDGGQPIGLIGKSRGDNTPGFSYAMILIYAEYPNDDEAWELTNYFLEGICAAMNLGEKYGAIASPVAA